VAFFDNDPAKAGTTLEGLPVLPPDAAGLDRCDLVLISSSFVPAILKQLAALGAAGRTALNLDDLRRRFGPVVCPPEPPAPVVSAAARVLANRWSALYACSRTADCPSHSGLHAITVATPDFAVAALRLAESLLAFHPEAIFTIYWLSPEIPALPDSSPPDRRIRHSTVGEALGAALPRILLRYSLGELCSAVRPLLFAHLLARPEVERLLYFDADILVLDRLDSSLDELSRASLLLTPHHISPGGDPDSDRLILASGIFNAGFYGLRRTAEAVEFCTWHAARVAGHCSVRPHQSVYLDQRWLDLVPGIFPGLGIHRDPGANVGFWNLAERGLELTPEFPAGVRCATGPLRFFHFSGYRASAADRIHELATIFGYRGSALRPLVDAYAHHTHPGNPEEYLPAQTATLRWHRRQHFPEAWSDLLLHAPGDEALWQCAANTFATDVGELRQLVAARAL